ncbi:MAG: hypothetical protein C5B50_24915 [Verrucomicrobia bacterium]|nr:MAG: hypothetical protein C5B50_24915 [Verrucomicrobiota bacterium]
MLLALNFQSARKVRSADFQSAVSQVSNLMRLTFQMRSAPSPGGTTDNSPAFQRWVRTLERNQSRRDDRESSSAVPDGTYSTSNHDPSVETLGYFLSSLRDYKFQKLVDCVSNLRTLHSPRSSRFANPPLQLHRDAPGSQPLTTPLSLALSFAFRCAALLLAISPLFRAQAWQMQQAPLMTPWASQVDTNNPLPEYPRPQMVRTQWLSLNGIWQFQPASLGDPVPTNQTLSSEILVPFPMESALSGVMAYHEWSYYRRLFTVPAGWSGKHILLHLDAVDWEAQVYINGQLVGDHKGGYDPFTFDVTSFLVGNGSQELIVWVYNPVDNAGEPRGKQTLHPGGIMYTSSTGIWQPIWLEPVDAAGISDIQLIPDVDNSRLRLFVNTFTTNGATISATAFDTGTPLTTVTGAPGAEIDLPIANPKLWSPDNPFLYDLRVSVISGATTNDSLSSYFGMRKIAVVAVNGVNRMFLNNQFVFEMGPLDQGFWPDGIYTAPTDTALKYDLDQIKALGFNSLRKHLKVERPRWYYWADKLGLLVWQDMPSVNSYTSNPQPIDTNQFEIELVRMVKTHWNSPAVIMWDIFNESQGQHDTVALVSEVAALDPSRLVNQASGGSYFGVGNVLDNHSYPSPGNPTSATQAPVDGEYGGIGFQMPGHLWNPALAGGNYIGAGTVDDIATIYDGFAESLVNYKSNGQLNAAIYTQITDVENEDNGLMTYDRVLKPPSFKIFNSNQKAKTGILNLSVVLPTSQTQGRTWRYNTNTATANLSWYATNFDDSTWTTGQAGFGSAGTPGAVVRTTWKSSDIWIRQQFTLGALGPTDLSNLVFNCYHDEGCEIYLNGVLAGSASGYTTSYVLLDLTDAGRNAILANATNLIAVHCHQTTGGQNIDVGISEQVLIADTLTVPSDAIGYWNLNETNGTRAADSSGGGNNGSVSNALWNPSGQVQGCLSFNGSNTYARINRTISNDFSIAFWVNTTSTGGSGQWYQGKGLVDGEVSGPANDFGTALVGSKFALGIGNPDTTILSTTSINDGHWHYCVATREAASGAIKAYIDGLLEATGTAGTQALVAPAFLRFGSLQTGVNFFNGSLDEVKIFNRPLGHYEIAAAYDNSASPCAAPTNLTALASNGQVALAWYPSVGATSYLVNRATQSGGPYTTIGSTGGTAFTDTSVTNGVTYYYVVAAVNALGPGANSIEVSALPFVLAAWFKADAITGLTNGALISLWHDLSGNTNDATQNNAAQQPAYITSSMNGLPVVRFNGDYLAFSRPVQDDFTILCVYRSSQGVGTGTAFYQGAGIVNGEMPGVVSDFGTSLNTNGFLLAGTGNPDTTIVSSTNNFNDGRPHLFTFKRTRSTGALALYTDGVLSGTATGGTQSLTAPSRLVLGAQQTLTFFFIGDIAEVKIFNIPLSDTDRAAEESALLRKYGLLPALTVNLVSGGITLSWPDWAINWRLWSTTNLAPPAAWSLITNQVQIGNGTRSVLLPADQHSSFFHLTSP